jgi:hypothetical protein
MKEINTVEELFEALREISNRKPTRRETIRDLGAVAKDVGAPCTLRELIGAVRESEKIFG